VQALIPFREAETHARLIDLSIHARSWMEDLIRREESARAVEITKGKPRKKNRKSASITPWVV